MAIFTLPKAVLAFEIPHGNVDETTTLNSKSRGCLSCHRIEESENVRLLTRSEERAVCYTCHNGTGASTNVLNEFSGNPDPPPVSRHPVPEGKIICSDCHTLHKSPENWDSTHTATEVVFLLRAKFLSYFGYNVSLDNSSWVDTATQKKLVDPDDICEPCHGTSSRLPGGDHLSNYKGTSHDATTTVSENTRVTCFNCHASHGSSLNALLETTISASLVTGNNNTVCYACHLSSVGAYSGQVLYESGKHNASSSTVALTTWPGSSYSSGFCLNCHNPHGAGNSDYRRELKNDLCFACHQETTSTVSSFQGKTAYNATPHSNGADLNTIWPTATETGSFIGSGGATAGECINCHDPHGRKDETTSTLVAYPAMGIDKQPGLCYGGGTSSCHASASGSASGVNIYERATASADNLSQHNITCAKCHNPHINTATERVADPDDLSQNYLALSKILLMPKLASFLSGDNQVNYINAGLVSGKASNNRVTFLDGDIPTPPRKKGSPFIFSYLYAAFPNNYISFCGKCHDGAPPPGIDPAGLNDILTPYQDSGASGDYHGAQAGSPGRGLLPPYSYGAASIQCSVCHDSHGSANTYALKETVNGSSGISITSRTDNAGITNFCLACHTAIGPQPGNCLDCHFHGSNADADGNTTF